MSQFKRFGPYASTSQMQVELPAVNNANSAAIAMVGDTFVEYISDGKTWLPLVAASALVNTAISILVSPSAASVSAGAQAVFSVVVNGTSPAYQWQRNPGGNTSFANISGATSSSYTTPATTVSGGTANSGDTYRAVVSNAFGPPATSSAAALTVTAVVVGVPVNSSLPTLTGTAQEGQSLAIAVGSWSNTPSSYAWQIIRGASTVVASGSGSTGSYTAVLADVGSTLKVSVVATNGTGASAAAVSTATSVVTAAAGGGAPTLLAEDRIAFEGDSLTNTSNAASYQFWALGNSGGRLYAPSGSVLAVGGQQVGPTSGAVTTAEMEHPTQIAAVVAQNPKVLVFLGGANDTSAGRTGAATYASIQNCLNGYLAGGIPQIIVLTVPPSNPFGSGPYNPSMESNRNALNSLLNAHSQAGVKVLDDAALAWDLTATSIHHDASAIHLTMAGHQLLGSLIATELNTRLGSASLPANTDASNMLVGAGANPALAGTAGAKTAGSGTAPTGEVADSWSVQNNVVGIVPVCAKSTLNGATAQQITISGTSTAAAGNIRFQTGIVTYAGQIGDGYEAWCDIELASGSVNVTGLVINCDTSTTWSPGSSQAIPGGATVSQVLRTKLTAPAAAADTGQQWRFNLIFGPAGACNAVVKIGKPFLRKITAAAPI